MVDKCVLDGGKTRVAGVCVCVCVCVCVLINTRYINSTIGTVDWQLDLCGVAVLNTMENGDNLICYELYNYC